MIQAHDHILFFGDSITDAGRDRENCTNANLGNGYVHLCASQLLSQFPEMDLQITNKGISGNRVADLEARLETDVLDLRPNLVSILIGINDTWRQFDSGVLSPIEEFEASYRRIAKSLNSRDVRLVICEPFVLPINDERRLWRADVAARIAVCRDVAGEFSALYVPFDALFAAASCRIAPAYWGGDGVHPSIAGHALMADAWLDAVIE
jgi:lysophospholipase L1-like esterase